MSEVSQPFCGTFDLLAWYEHPTDKDKSGLVVLDWKTNKDLKKDFSRGMGKFLLPPFNEYYEEPLVYITEIKSINAYSGRDGKNVWYEYAGEFDVYEGVVA